MQLHLSRERVVLHPLIRVRRCLLPKRKCRLAEVAPPCGARAIVVRMVVVTTDKTFDSGRGQRVSSARAPWAPPVTRNPITSGGTCWKWTLHRASAQRLAGHLWPVNAHDAACGLNETARRLSEWGHGPEGRSRVDELNTRPTASRRERVNTAYPCGPGQKQRTLEWHVKKWKS